jgi:hypothetical protein
VQSAVTRMHPESEEEEGRHAEPTAYLSQGVSGPVQRRVAPWHTMYGIGAPGALEKSVCYLPSHGRAKAAIFSIHFCPVNQSHSRQAVISSILSPHQWRRIAVFELRLTAVPVISPNLAPLGQTAPPMRFSGAVCSFPRCGMARLRAVAGWSPERGFQRYRTCLPSRVVAVVGATRAHCSNRLTTG